MGAVWGFTGSADELISDSMSGQLIHRGGQQVASHVNPAASVFLRDSHRGFCIGKVASELKTFPDSDITIGICGWINGVDDVALSRALESSTDDFYRALANRYLNDGFDAAAVLRGAFILVVRIGDTVYIARDGFGNRTIFYARHGDRWLFAIEPKAITSVPGFKKSIRPAALAQYLACSFVPGSGTMLENVFELPAGHTVKLTSGSEPTLKRWFCFEDEEHYADNELSDEQLVVNFRNEMERAVAERIPRGEPVGVFLSGGLDSSVITAELARQIGGKNVRTWAIHFGEGYRNELEFAKAVADRCGTVHQEVHIEPRAFISRLRQMVWHLDDPIGDPITQPNFELAAHVSSEVNFIFNGEGGDPCFGGPKNIPMMLHHWYGGLDRDENFRERLYLQSYRRAWEEIEFVLSDEVRQQIDLERDLDSVFAPYLRTEQPRLFLNRLMSINIREKGAHLIQPKVERMLAAHGITPLAPLFDERIIKLSMQLPARLKLHQGIEKVVLKRAYENELPTEVINRPKSGMRVPVHYWFRSEMRRYARKILSRRNVRKVGIFNAERVKQLLDYDIEEGRGRYGLRLWMLITFELWRRIVIDGEYSPDGDSLLTSNSGWQLFKK